VDRKLSDVVEVEIKQATGGKSIGNGEQEAFPMYWWLRQNKRGRDKASSGRSNPQKYGIIGDV